MDTVLTSLVKIAGEKYVSNHPEELWYYSRDPGLTYPHPPDYVVAPRTVEQIQKIVVLANEQKIPIVPMGNGMALTGLVVPRRGGIVLDMKKMNRILEVNEKGRYVIVEGGTSQGMLKAYLEKNFPHLRHSVPDAPPVTTIAANVSLHGQGRLTQQYGFNSEMVTGLEVVLPTGEVCKVGSCSMSPYWFSKGPTLPDLSGLFLGWLGSTGIITKLGLKLYPRKKIRDVEIFVTDRDELVQEIVAKVTHAEMVEDITVWFQPKPLMFKGNNHITIYLTGDTEKEVEFKRELLWDTLKEFIVSKDGGFMSITPPMKPPFLEMPQRGIAAFADVPKGGGFEYSGPITLIEHFPQLAQKIKDLGAKYNVVYAGTARIIDVGHVMMMGISFAFNRADTDMMDRARKALSEAAEFAMDLGGIPWKPNVEEQEMAMDRMDPNTLRLIKMIKENLDPQGIMNPGIWEVH